ncbi:DUF2634 domain-containing protein [uncultured Flavonifractor sp.]|uniref:DUF2634 domain-containing protein n=1 Tax=Candidatus Flavonifractor intestinigallinarum TaxID=2838586 RepID=A0A9D2MM77_9FIRM|nr:DUF2634 domain-containing protein [uncultured Flavonifractor sp.]HJB81000.1 DUF2634 domain-containing protein [Candidatus Flavonifractor intestinigallinarum]
MTLFPMFSTPASGGSADLPLFTDVAMDYDAGTPRWESGQPVVVIGLEAVKSWAWRAVATARYLWPIFDWSYGCELEALVGQPYQADTKISEATRYLQDALLVSPYITAVDVTEASFNGSIFRMRVDLTTVYGKEGFYV